MKLKSGYVNKILGTNLNLNEIISCLKKMSYNANILNNDEINIEIPPWRTDILHPIDLVEDVAVGYGFDNFKIKKLNSLTFGQSLKNRDFFQGLRSIMIGLGFNEITTFTISNENDEYNKLGLKEKKHAIIENPIGEDYTCIRVGLIPSLLKILNENRHHPLPQKIFELGIIVDESFKNKYNLACIKIGAKTNFTECKSIFETIMRGIGLPYELDDKDHSGFVNGRCASIIINNKEVGYFGELHPKTIKEFQLEYPIIAIEIQLNKLFI
jgi:phenylalanyl-tRNA synthetase beta chain